MQELIATIRLAIKAYAMTQLRTMNVPRCTHLGCGEKAPWIHNDGNCSCDSHYSTSLYGYYETRSAKEIRFWQKMVSE